MAVMKTPGVYIVEKNAFPNSVVEVATAVPAFIGHTEKALNGSKSLKNTPWRITSMAEFHSYFGGAPTPLFGIVTKEKDLKDTKEDPDKASKPEPETSDDNDLLTYKRKHTLYYHMLFFFANGGGPCYIVSVGSYDEELNPAQFTQGIETLLKEQEPTMVVVPEAVNMDASNCKSVQEAMIKHCGYDMQNRFAIFDIFNGDKSRKDAAAGDVVNNFREQIGSNYLSYGAAYYPWVNTGILQESDITLLNFKAEAREALMNLLKKQLDDLFPIPQNVADQEKVAARKNEYTTLFDNITTTSEKDGLLELHKTLRVISPLYKDILKEALFKVNCLPASAAMAGIFTMVDNTRGVWKAPANVSIANVTSPTVNLTHEDQEDLNVPLSGKAINAIRSFTGEGIKVWGARTLDGNSLDWRYINVRRTMIMLEESIKNAARAYVFDPNVANTWVSVRSMISNFLNGIWKRGGLAGAVPDDAYSVHVGLGDTMTPEDILEGIMRVTVLVAITRPAEFIEITFQQQMQKS